MIRRGRDDAPTVGLTLAETQRPAQDRPDTPTTREPIADLRHDLGVGLGGQNAALEHAIEGVEIGDRRVRASSRLDPGNVLPTDSDAAVRASEVADMPASKPASKSVKTPTAVSAVDTDMSLV